MSKKQLESQAYARLVANCRVSIKREAAEDDALYKSLGLKNWQISVFEKFKEMGMPFEIGEDQDGRSDDETVRAFFRGHNSKVVRERDLEKDEELCKRKIAACFDEVARIMLFPELAQPLFYQVLKEKGLPTDKRGRGKDKRYVDCDRELFAFWNAAERLNDKKRGLGKYTKQGLAKYLAENEREKFAFNSKRQTGDEAQEAIVRRLDEMIEDLDEFQEKFGN
ncbi:MAG TPA: hypothetical protein VMV19_09295 [Xanthobacteraceae bacterium]|nr:hypothetical protein [Xanthobacteraceae bacterium]